MVASQESGLEFAWKPIAELGQVALLPPSLDILIPRALSSDGALYVTYDCRTNSDERRATYLWP